MTRGEAKAYRAAIVAARDAVTEDNARLGIRVLFPDWAAGAHAVGEVYNADGQTWACFAAYDNAARYVPRGRVRDLQRENVPLHGRHGI